MRILITPLALLAALFFLPQTSTAAATTPGSAPAITTITMVVSGSAGRKKGKKSKSGKNGSSSRAKPDKAGAPSRAKRTGETNKRSGSPSAKKEPSREQRNKTENKRDARTLNPVGQNVVTPGEARSSVKVTKEIGIQAGRSQLTKSRSNKRSRRKNKRLNGGRKAVAGTSGVASKSPTTAHSPSGSKTRANGAKKSSRSRRGHKTPSPTTSNLNTASTSAAGPDKRTQDRKGKGRKTGGVKRMSTQSAGTASVTLSRAPNNDSPI